jgi:hypothetical protein
LIFGDRTGGPPEGVKVLAQAVRDANLLGPDLVMTVGDLVQGYNARAEWTTEMKEYREIMERLDCPWFPVAGNHDIYWSGSAPPPGHHESDYEEHFGPLWYWFPHKNAAFVVLYSDEGDPATNRKGWDAPALNRMSDRQLAWLAKTLGETRSYDHVFAFLHHPRWLKESYPGTNWDQVHALLAGAGNVTAVFAGHIHRQRYDGVRDGIEYHTLSVIGGNAPMDRPGTGWLHHLDLVTVRKDRITVATIPVGTVLDPREMTAERWAEIDRLRFLAPETDGALLALDEAGRGKGEYRLVWRNTTARPVSITVEARYRDPSIWFEPDHRHLTVEPGGAGEARFAWWRDPRADPFSSLQVPSFSVDLEYLAETSRVALPTREFPAVVGFPAAVFAPLEERALTLDGRSGHLRYGPDALFLPDGPFTLEAWVRPASVAGRRAVASKAEWSEFGLFVNDGAPGFHLFSGERYASAEAGDRTLRRGRWQHLAGVHDGSEIRLYLDGSLVASAAATGTRKRNGHPLYIGADTDGRGEPGSFFAGSIDEVRLSRVARYSGDSFAPSRRFEPDADTLLLLHLDRLVGPLLPDHSPHRRHVLPSGSASIQ